MEYFHEQCSVASSRLNEEAGVLPPVPHGDIFSFQSRLLSSNPLPPSIEYLGFERVPRSIGFATPQ